MRRILLPLLLGLALFLSACKSSPPVASSLPPTPTPTPSATASNPATPTPLPTQPIPAPRFGALTDSFRQTLPDKPDVVLVEGDLSLPYIENADGVPPYAAINRWYEQLMEGLKSDLADSVSQAKDDYETSQALGDVFSGYSSEHIFEVMYQTDTTLGVLRTNYGFSGGPYPTLLYMADRFDMTTGIFLSFADFFTDAAKAEEIIRAEVIRQAAGFPDYNQDAVASAFNRESFYPTADGLVFFYQPQTLNPQAGTKPEFQVPYRMLEGLLSR